MLRNPNRVLVIDDEPDMLQMLSFMLGLDGFEITAASSGAEALEVVRREDFDLVLTDLRMPGMDGLTLINALKQLAPQLRVIVATGYATAETSAQCAASGAYALIKKPFELTELSALLREALATTAEA
ncbi:MAG: response regulator [Myxococcota bacterium]|jgi:DNA-binding NtrC family response regulator|nr:response regulator [Myxococcota bacterium]